VERTGFYSCLVAILLLSRIIVFSQQDAQFSQYMFVNSYINPASCGINNTTDIAFIYRNQWTPFSTPANGGISGNPQSQLLTFSTKIQQINSGIGIYIINDQLGPINRNLNANLSYAYHIDLGQDIKLSLGVRIGIFNQSINTANWIPPTNFSDNTIDNIKANPSRSNVDVGGGVWLNSPRYFVGISMAHINKPTLFLDAYGNSNINQHGYITGGYNFIVNENWVLTPSALIKTDFSKFSLTQIDLSALLHFNKDLFWGGLSYRSGEAMIAMVGIGLLKDRSLKVGYAFDLVVNGSSAKSGTSHEIMLTYSKPVADIIPRPIIRTPRFRY
jgi:type IX secretion system PorP/SprF family membrane protein